MIYFVQEQEPPRRIKIGYSKNPERRFHNLQTASAIELALVFTMVGTEDDERTIHRQFAQHRLRGEWFNDCSEIGMWMEAQLRDQRKTGASLMRALANVERRRRWPLRTPRLARG